MSTNNTFPMNWDTENGNLFETKSKEYASRSPFGEESLFALSDYEDENIDFEKLIELILAKKDVIFNYKDFIGHTKKMVKYYFPGDSLDARAGRMSGNPTSYTVEENIETEIPLRAKNFYGERELQLEARLNKSKAIVNIRSDNQTDIPGGMEFEIDYHNQRVFYKVHYYYIGKKRVYEKDNTNNIAFTVSTSSYEDLEAFLSLCRLKPSDSFKNIVETSFLKAIEKAKSSKEITLSGGNLHSYAPEKEVKLNWLYEHIPPFVAKKLDFNKTLTNVFQMGGDNDYTAGIATILRLLDPQKTYDYFYRHPQQLIDIAKSFDDSAPVKKFYLFFTALSFSFNEKIKNIREFYQGENAHIETNILFGDENGKVELTNELQLPSIAFNGLNFINLLTSDLEINNPNEASNQFHPLDIVYISRYDAVTKQVDRMPSIALHAKHLGDSSEWSDVLDATIAAVDVLSIIISGGALNAGIKGVAKLIAILDISISTINLALLNNDVKSQLGKTSAGKWFVDYWPIISLCAGLGTISYYLAKGIIRFGPQVKGQVNDKALAGQIDELMEESRKVVDEIIEVSNTIGSGGILKFEKIISRNMLKQEHEMSCAAACIKQIAKDNRIEISESAIRNFANTTRETGTFPEGMIQGMIRSFNGHTLDYGMKYIPSMTDVQMAKKLSKDGSWIAFVLPRNSRTQHAIIVDKIIGNKVYIRDPWPIEETFKKGKKGVVGIIDINEFEYSWKFAQNWCFRILK